jgi:hypothetical protein
LPQEYYPSMVPLSGFYGNFLPYDNIVPPRSSSPNSGNFDWNAAAAPGSRSGTNQHNVPQASSLNLHSNSPSFLDPPHQSLRPSGATSNPTRGQQMQALASSSNGNSSSPDIELTEAEHTVITDEKRRRNTAASGTSLFFCIIATTHTLDNCICWRSAFPGQEETQDNRP